MSQSKYVDQSQTDNQSRQNNMSRNVQETQKTKLNELIYKQIRDNQRQ